MALVLGTNCGFVTVAPVADPNGSNVGGDSAARAHKCTTPAGISKITEVGWWHDDYTAGPYQLCLYSHNAGTDLPDALLYSTDQANCGSAPGWEVDEVDWDVGPETVYWLALQIDGVTGDVRYDYEATGGRASIDVAISAPQNPWVNDAILEYILAIYGVVSEAAGGVFVPHYYQKLLAG